MNTTANILIVDDKPANLRLLMKVLSEQDYTVRPAPSGKYALDVLQNEAIDLILLDILMPGMDGYEVCVRLKAQEATCDIPIIFLSALNDIFDKVKAFESGGVDYITKPFQEKEVLARVQTHLDLQRARKVIEVQNQELLEIARLREDVERITHHDLKTPLNAVIAYPQSILLNTHLTQEERDQLKRIEAAGYRMLRMINMSLDLVKMERGMYEFTPVPVNLVQVIKKVTLEIHPLIQKKRLTVQILLNGQPARNQDVFSVLGEELLCYSMLANLIANAINALPDRGLVTIRLAEEETTVIRIHNAGSVAEEIRGRFFEKYVTSGQDTRGTGLGTYSAKLMVETQHGAINMASSEQAGTTITIRLPKVAQHPLDSSCDPSADSAPARIKTPSQTPHPPSKDVLTSEALTGLPKKMVVDLQQAVEALDIDATNRIIEQIRQQNAPLAEALAELVKQYRFDRLQVLCEESASFPPPESLCGGGGVSE